MRKFGYASIFGGGVFFGVNVVLQKSENVSFGIGVSARKEIMSAGKNGIAAQPHDRTRQKIEVMHFDRRYPS